MEYDISEGNFDTLEIDLTLLDQTLVEVTHDTLVPSCVQPPMVKNAQHDESMNYFMSDSQK